MQPWRKLTASLFAFVATIIAAYLDGRLGYDLRIIGDSKGELFLVLAGTFTFVAAKLFIGFSISQKNAHLL